jgi:hypothetical protein
VAALQVGGPLLAALLLLAAVGLYAVRRNGGTLAGAAGRAGGPGAPLNVPVVLASNFSEGGDYARVHGTATWTALEAAVQVLEGGRHCTAFASGMAAASALWCVGVGVNVRGATWG